MTRFILRLIFFFNQYIYTYIYAFLALVLLLMGRLFSHYVCVWQQSEQKEEERRKACMQSILFWIPLTACSLFIIHNHNIIVRVLEKKESNKNIPSNKLFSFFFEGGGGTRSAERTPIQVYSNRCTVQVPTVLGFSASKEKKKKKKKSEGKRIKRSREEASGTKPQNTSFLS